MKNIYITTSIAYVNAAPHIGFAMELIEADAIARWHRQQGNNVYFLTGTDEHGTKIYRTAKDQGISPQELCDQNAERFLALTKALNISNNDFIRTTEQRHKKGAQKLWNKILAKKDLEKRNFEGLYCAGCEAFVTEKELVDGKCPNHQKAPEKLAEENWFFKLSDYSEVITNLIESKKMEIVPDYRKNEILTVAKEGLKDVSFTRPKKVLPWGVDVPNDDEQVMYVWCDALSNYITALGYGSDNEELFEQFWNNGQIIHVIGKDILRFHAGIWPAMLTSAGEKIPDNILVHGFLTSEGQKMSKSLGNVVDPFEVVEQESVDALRFFLLHEVPFGRDADFSHERFTELKNAYLADNLGNLLQRVHTLAKRLEMTDFKTVLSSEIEKEYQQAVNKQKSAMQEFALHEAISAPFEFLAFLNKQINTQEPWKLLKEKPKKAKEILFDYLEALRRVSVMLSAFLPETSARINKVLGLDEKGEWTSSLGESQILFPKERL